MHFLCLHGMGTNSQILEMQTASLRYDWGDNHTFEFVEGTISWPIAPEIRSLFAPDDQFFAYFDPQDPATCQVALANLERYIAHHGPFDGVLAFSQGAALAATHIVRMARRTPAARPFRLAIFIAGGVAVDPDRLMDHGELLQLSPETDADAGAIAIPSAHIYGRNDDLWPGSSETLSSLCLEELRSVYVHQGGHEIPGSSGSSRGDLAGTVHVIRRAVDKAEHLQ